MWIQVSGTDVATPVFSAFSRLVSPVLLRIVGAELKGTEIIVGCVEAPSMCARTTASPWFAMSGTAVRITLGVTGSDAACNVVDAVVLTAHRGVRFVTVTVLCALARRASARRVIATTLREP